MAVRAVRAAVRAKAFGAVVGGLRVIWAKGLTMADIALCRAVVSLAALWRIVSHFLALCRSVSICV